MSAIISVESGRNPYAIHDNTTGLSYFPSDANGGVRIVRSLLQNHHNLDVGISQINSNNFAGIGLSVSGAFDACRNIQAGAQILHGDYLRAAERYGPGQYALQRALGAYNTGSIYEGDDYIAKILAAASIATGTRYAIIAPKPHTLGIRQAPRYVVIRPTYHPKLRVQQKMLDPNSAPMMLSTMPKPML